MEKEVSFVVEIAVMLIAVSALIGIIWFTVFMGNDMADNVSMEATNLLGTVETGPLIELCDTDTILPASAAYSIIRTYSTYIPSYTCKIPGCEKYGETIDLSANESPCILQHMTGKVSLEVNYTDNGWFEVVIHSLDDDWFE